MKFRFILPLAAGIAVVAAAAKAPKDPVLLTVDGDPVTLSEFEYFYHKNQDQQLEQETLDQYLNRFIDYRLKVAAARHERVDTTADFRKEFRQYRRGIAAPYLTDSLTQKQVVRDSYNRTLSDRNVQHLMVPLDKVSLADSLRALLVAGADFHDLVDRFSTDPGKQQNRGDYGWIHAMQFPYEWEEAVWATPVGEVSPVIRTDFGLHLVKVLESRPTEGEVHSAHILIKYKGKRTPETEAQAKAIIDSIYTAGVLGGYDFAQLARRYSDCPSRAEGGDLGWNQRGRMVAEFDSVLFSLPDSAVSEPFPTRFGYHIVKRLGSRPVNPADVVEQIEGQIKRDRRSYLPVKAKMGQLIKEYNGKVIPSGMEHLLREVNTKGYNEALPELKTDNTPLISVGDSTVTIGQIWSTTAPRMNPSLSTDEQLTQFVDDRLGAVALNYEDRHLEQKYPYFRHQSNEFRDGLMLFAVADREVWQRPNNDPEGLNAFFQAHRKDYADWESPRWKGYIVYATTDSLMQEVNNFLATAKPQSDSVGVVLKREFPRNIKIERVVLPKNQNDIVDFVAFGGPEPKMASKGRWQFYTTYLGHVIDAPEEVADVRGRVTNDWVAELEEQWVEKLRKTYPVKVNKKVLKKVK